ncbi:MAG: flagellar hook-basal body complex protein, partial [Proteobacteria bacterium]|nr:flagellar hook-basal body complex protein [Pseudomonadota bacterium]
MSLFGALFSGVSGLAAQSQAMGIIADNITNVTTTAFKRTTSEFSSLVTGSRTSTSFAPGGVKPTVRQLVDVQGLLQASNSPLDIGINGSGFFVVSDIAAPTATTGQFAFTRAGSFTPDKNGDLKNAAGFFLRGYEVTDTTKGTITSDRTNLLATTTVNVTNFNGTAEKTTIVKIQANLQSTQAISAQEGTYDPTVAGTNMASGNVTPDFKRSVQIFDSQG